MHLSPLLRVFLLASAVFASRVHGAVAPPPSLLSPLDLVCEVSGETCSLSSVDGETIVISSPDGPRPAPEAARWAFRGTIRSHAALLHGSPHYILERDSRHDDGRQRARVLLEHHIDIAPPRGTIKDPILARWAETLTFARDPFTWHWNADPSSPGVVVAAWMLDGHVTHAQVQPVPQVGPGREYTLEFEFSLDPSEAAGQPVLLLWRDGAWVPATPFSSHAPTQAAWHAVMFNDRIALDQAIRAGARLGDRRARGGLTLAHYAAESGALAVLERLVTARPKSLLDLTEDGASPLVWAASKGRTPAVSFLLERQTSKATQPQFVSDALTHAVRSGHTACVLLLLPRLKAADLKGGVPDPMRLLPWVQGYVDLGVLLDQQAPPAPPKDVPALASSRPRDWTPLLFEHVRAGRLPMVRHLLTAMKCAPNVTWMGETPLVTAAKTGNEATVRELLAAGADPNRAAVGGRTPLMAAAQAEAASAVELLLARGAKPNIMNDEGMSALHFAAERDAVAIVSTLLDAGADVQVCNIQDITPLDLALLSGATASAQVLMSRGACIGLGAPYSQDLILAAVTHDIEEPIATAIQQGWPATSTFSGTWPALRVAELLDATQCAGVLRAFGATSDPERPVYVAGPNELDIPLTVTVGPRPVDPRRPDEVFPATRMRMRVLVDPTGRVLFPTAVDRADAPVRRAAVKAAQQMRFAPPLRQGKPVAAFTEVEIAFPASRDRVFTTSEADERPPSTRMTRPYQPGSAKRDRNARVITEYVINAYGRVEQVEILESSGKAYTDSVKLALSQWSFRPVTHRGTPIAIRMNHTFDFDSQSD